MQVQGRMCFSPYGKGLQKKKNRLCHLPVPSTAMCHGRLLTRAVTRYSEETQGTSVVLVGGSVGKRLLCKHEDLYLVQSLEHSSIEGWVGVGLLYNPRAGAH